MKRLSLLLMIAGLFSANMVYASGGEHELADIEIEHSQQAYQRGAKVVMDVCNLCHELKYIRYRNLLDIGFSEDEVNAFRGDKAMGEVLSASLTPPLAKKAFGLVPPDLSLMAKARKGGGQYVYTLMTSFHEVAENKYDNKLFPGIRMPDIFEWSLEIGDERRAYQEQRIRDVTSFLVWASDPQADERRTMGVYVIAYLVLLTFLLWLWKRKVWADVKK